jgi:hypothetical protein
VEVGTYHASCPWELVQVGTVPRLLSMGTCPGRYCTTPPVHGNLSRYHSSFPWELFQVQCLMSVGTCPLTTSRYPASFHGNLSAGRYPSVCPLELFQVPRILSMGTCQVLRFLSVGTCPGTMSPVHGNLSTVSRFDVFCTWKLVQVPNHVFCLWEHV